MRAFFFIISIFYAASVLSQTSLPVDETTGKVSYCFSIPFRKSISNDAAYEIAQRFFTEHASVCTRSNNTTRVVEKVNEKNKASLEHEFANETPLQSLNPSERSLSVKVITKYDGGGEGIIHLLYLEYYMVVKINGNQMCCEISDIRYNHVNEKSYNFQRVTNWQNFSSIEPINTIEYLVKNDSGGAEWKYFYSFLNEDVTQLYAQFSAFIKTSGGLTLNTAK